MSRFIPLFSLLLLLFPLCASAEGLTVVDNRDNEINVEVMPASSDLLLILLVDHEKERLLFEGMVDAINGAGIEIWRVDLLADYFIPRSSENIRTLSGEGVSALIKEAHQRSNKRIVVAAYDRMPLPLLRGVRLWQQRQSEQQSSSSESRLAGALLFYPNLFGPPPVAGEDVELDPIVGATNIPVTIFQPESGAQRLRLAEVMKELWKGGSATFSYIVPGVRDWFFMHPLPGEELEGQPATEAEKRATAMVPQKLKLFVDMMSRFPKPSAPAPMADRETVAKQVTELVQLESPMSALPFELPDISGRMVKLEDYKGEVTLVNFWATWCPPCVEEVPSLNQLGQRYQGKDFKVLSIDFRESESKVNKFSKKISVDYPILLDSKGKVSLAWKVFGLPSSFIVDRQGRIRYSVNRAIDWNTPEVWRVVEQLLDEPKG